MNDTRSSDRSPASHTVATCGSTLVVQPITQPILRCQRTTAGVPLPPESNTPRFQFLQPALDSRAGSTSSDSASTTCPAQHLRRGINSQPSTSLLLSMRPFSHKSPARVYVTLHGLHDSNGNLRQMKIVCPALLAETGYGSASQLFPFPCQWITRRTEVPKHKISNLKTLRFLRSLRLNLLSSSA